MTGLDTYKSEKDSITHESMKKGAWNQLIALGFYIIQTVRGMENC